MLRRSTVINQYDFSGGINIREPAHLIADNQLFANISTFDGTKNCYWNGSAITKRLGTLKVNSAPTGNKLVNGMRFYRSLTPFKTTICASDNGTYVRHYYLDGSNVFQLITKADPQIATGNSISLTSWKNALYSASGIQKLQKITYSGSWAIADITTLTSKPAIVYLHKDRLWVAGGDMPYGYLECSAYDDDTKWSESDGEAFNVGLDDGDPIRALKSFGNDLVIYKHDSIWVMKGDNLENWFQGKSIDEIGCYSPASVVDIGFGHIFLSVDNVYFFDEEQLVPIGDNIKPWLDLIPSQYRKNAAACYSNGFYRLAITSGVYNDHELLFDVNKFKQGGTRAWWNNGGRNISNYVTYDGPDDDNFIYICDSNAGHLRKIETGNQDDTVDFEMQTHSKYYGFGEPNVEKKYDRVKFDVANNVGVVYATLIKGFSDELSQEYQFSTGMGTSIWGTGVWGTAMWLSPDKARALLQIAVPSKFDGTILSASFRHPTHEEGVKIHGISISYAQKTF